jgi:hypothetical protein
MCSYVDTNHEPGGQLSVPSASLAAS